MFSFFRDRSKSRKASQQRGLQLYSLERLEDRSLLTTFTVLNLNDSGTGSFRQALLDANSSAGADTIEFSVSGTVTLSKSLPSVTDVVTIDGTSAPGFEGAPVVEIDYNGKGGLTFTSGASLSTVQSLALVNGSGNGITLNTVSGFNIFGNYIGLDLNGSTAEGNKGSGIELISSSNVVIGGTTAATRNVVSSNKKDGITLTDSTYNTISGNYIGTNADGSANRANGKDGVSLNNSDGNQIGQSNPVTGVSYYDTADVSLPVTGWQGIRGGDDAGQYIIVGTSGSSGLLFEGTIEGEGTSYAIDFPGAETTSIYGPDNLGEGQLRLVGVYKNEDFETADVTVNGFLYEGTTSALDRSDISNYRTINYPGAKFNYVHSTMGGLVVGNYDSAAAHGSNDLPLGPGHAYLYDIASDTFLTDIVYPGSLSNTAYGIWYNGGTKYTIVGGYSLTPGNNFEDQDHPIGRAYMVDYDADSQTFSNWTSFAYPNGVNYVTHFEGISSVEKGVYTLNADSVQTGSDNPSQGSLVTVRRNSDGTFGDAEWVDLNYTGVDSQTHVTSSNSVYGNQVVGIVIHEGDSFSYQATVNVAFTLSNVISANLGNGIGIYGSNNNVIAMNYIGTDVTGTIDLGNSLNGILVTSKSSGNMIGGETIAGNDPTDGVFVRPPQGNLISGNNKNGVLINGKSTYNQLSGNFIGTTATGNAALGNFLDGVAIDKADFNSLIGCNLVQDPFVYYNVISGNGGNGLRVTDSDGTTIQANFFGIGADNNTAVGNGLNGVLVNGNSARTTMGGPIPLGNVVAANAGNGVEIADKASFFVSFNSFLGLAAFTDNPNLGNGKDGLLITSSGGNILIRTNVISNNDDDGIEISGKAQGVQIVENIIGLNTGGEFAMGNAGNGIEIGDKAKKIVIGGATDSFSIIPQNIVSGNLGNGIAILGKAKDIGVNGTFIGTNVHGLVDLGNAADGLFIGSGAKDVVVGSADDDLLTVISGNTGNGIQLDGATDVTIVGTYIGVGREGGELGNSGYGVLVKNSSKNSIGSTSVGLPGNTIAYNGLDGVFIQSGSQNGIHQNSIFDNTQLGIRLNSGANNNQVAPVLLTVNIEGTSLTVTGTLTGKARTEYTVEYFGSLLDDGSGRLYLGSQKVTTGSNGTAALSFNTEVLPIDLTIITATATDSKDNTSAFSEGLGEII